MGRSCVGDQLSDLGDVAAALDVDIAVGVFAISVKTSGIRLDEGFGFLAVNALGTGVEVAKTESASTPLTFHIAGDVEVHALGTFYSHL